MDGKKKHRIAPQLVIYARDADSIAKFLDCDVDVFVESVKENNIFFSIHYL